LSNKRLKNLKTFFYYPLKQKGNRSATRYGVHSDQRFPFFIYFSVFLTNIPDAIPIAMPATVPEMPSSGRYVAIAALSITMQAAIICPELWATPPTTLTPTEENLPILWTRIIRARANTAPETLYVKDTKFPNNSADRKTLRIETVTADCAPKV
jgi:hypothetical protein